MGVEVGVKGVMGVEMGVEARVEVGVEGKVGVEMRVEAGVEVRVERVSV